MYFSSVGILQGTLVSKCHSQRINSSRRKESVPLLADWHKIIFEQKPQRVRLIYRRHSYNE